MKADKKTRADTPSELEYATQPRQKIRTLSLEDVISEIGNETIPSGIEYNFLDVTSDNNSDDESIPENIESSEIDYSKLSADKVIKYINDKINSKEEIAERDSEGNSLLHIVCAMGLVDECQTLIKHGFDVNIQDEDAKETPVSIAIECGEIAIFNLLLDNKANPLSEVSDCGLTMLHLAALYDHAEIIPRLIKNGVPVDSISNNGYTPLYQAAVNGNSSSVKVLVENGADVHAVIDGHEILSNVYDAIIKSVTNKEIGVFTVSPDEIESRKKNYLEIWQELIMAGAELVKPAVISDATPYYIKLEHGYNQGVIADNIFNNKNISKDVKLDKQIISARVTSLCKKNGIPKHLDNFISNFNPQPIEEQVADYIDHLVDSKSVEPPKKWASTVESKKSASYVSSVTGSNENDSRSLSPSSSGIGSMSNGAGRSFF